MSPDLQRWFDEALLLVPEGTPEYPYRADADAYLRPLLKRCRSNSKKTFWQWLRLTLAKNEDSSVFLDWMWESRVSPETDAPFHYEINGDIALIDLGTCVWKIPSKDLTWAKAICPVYTRELPPLELAEKAEIRAMKTRLRSCTLGYNERREWQRALVDLESQVDAGYIQPMPTRHGIFKRVDGQEVPVARLYLRADVNEEVDFADGDPTNFGLVPARSIARPFFQDGVALVPGIADPRNPERVEGERLVPNLYVVQGSNNPHARRNVSQEGFEQDVEEYANRPEQPGNKGIADTNGEFPVPAKPTARATLKNRAKEPADINLLRRDLRAS